MVPPPIDRRYAPPADVERAVAENDLSQMGIRPGLREYVRDLWNRRSFIRVLATSKASAQNQNTYLGQLWALLSPTLNAAVYVIIFGFVLQIGRAGIENTIAFIVVGVFMFRFFERSVMAGSHSLNKNMNLIRSVQFPPCCAADRRGGPGRAHGARAGGRGHDRDLLRLGGSSRSRER